MMTLAFSYWVVLAGIFAWLLYRSFYPQSPTRNLSELYRTLS